MMKTRTLPTSTSMIPVVGLLVLAGAFFVAHPSLAQTELDCPLPPDWTPPPVTAEQVENGSASLKDFALVMRDQSRDASQGATGTGQLTALDASSGRKGVLIVSVPPTWCN